jgi:hypothetical protein
MIAVCNKTHCQRQFVVPDDTPREKFCGGAAARILKPMVCPCCGRMDSHWVYAQDVLPEFTGTNEEIRQQAMAWRRDN